MSKVQGCVCTGLGIIIERDAKILIGKRRGSHAPYFSIPGGKLEPGESLEESAIREVFEETGLVIHEPRVVAVVNDLVTFRAEGVHFVSVTLHANQVQGEPLVKEPEKCELWTWCDPRHLPQPHFYSSTQGVACWLQGAFYEPPPRE